MTEKTAAVRKTVANSGELMPDTIRAKGLNIAAELRELKDRLRSEASAMEQEIEDVADAATTAYAAIGDRVETFLANGEAVRASLKEHAVSLTKLPDAARSTERPSPAGPDALTQLERRLSNHTSETK